MKFKEKLKTNNFLITSELFPPKGTNISLFLQRAKYLSCVDAVNVTDNQKASVRAGSLTMSKILIDNGIEPILQITSRDKNRLAIQSEMLSANIFGIENILLLSGDHPSVGENPTAKPVYDLDTIQLIRTAKILENGFDLSGKKLYGIPSFCLGAAINPTLKTKNLQYLMIEKKINSGINFFQTQAIFNVEDYKKFLKKIKHIKTKILPGVILIKSIEFMNRIKTFPGINIPNKIQDRIKKSKNVLEESIKICSEIISELRLFADGVHIMTIGMEKYIKQIVENSLK
ncbi:MAG: methylenetetrahydrofolate reductase [Endomicrobium sp.]|jgi:5,10-methylenetetrahydrofolate reductase|nr:methylenetetrahydrofolate reductase [Endomicrobium sp.]